MNIGLCGGTFDPFHRGHLAPILAVRDTMHWEGIVFIPAWRQPFKLDRRSASAYHRFGMAVVATQDEAGVLVSPIELERGAVSYTVDTLETIRSAHQEGALDWIIGDDNVPDLEKWRNLDRILELANFVVLSRSGDARERLPERLRGRVSSPSERGTCGSIVFASNATIPISSTAIREKVRHGEAIDGLVDPRVSRYIERNRLYREDQT